MSGREPTEDERLFFAALSGEVGGLRGWYHRDRDGNPWMTVSLDLLRDGGGTWATLRLDYDGERIVGGWSPAHLHVDGARRADDELVKTGDPDGVDVAVWDAEEAASRAASWFHSVMNAHLGESP